MWAANLLVVVLVSCAFVYSSAVRLGDAKVLYEWVVVDYDFPNETVRQHYIDTGLFIPDNNAVTGVKQWKDDIYVTVARWRPGVPATLNKVIVKDGKTILQPYPSWAAQTLDDKNALQYVQSMEIDTQGRMWIVDVGRRNFFSANPKDIVNAPAKFWLYDIEKDKLLLQYEFPDEVAAHNASFLNDIVVEEQRGFGYISDAGNGGLVVLDINKPDSRRFSDNSTQVEPGVVIRVAGKDYPQLKTPTDGIALNPNFTSLFYCSLTGLTLHSIPTAILRNFSYSQEEISKYVVNRGKKVSESDGMAFSNNGLLYFGVLGLNGVYSWNASQYSELTPESQQPVVLNNETMQWIDTFGFDNKGSLIFTANKLQLYFSYTMDFSGKSGPNFRVWKVYIDGDSYLKGKTEKSSDAAFTQNLKQRMTFVH